MARAKNLAVNLATLRPEPVKLFDKTVLKTPAGLPVELRHPSHLQAVGKWITREFSRKWAGYFHKATDPARDGDAADTAIVAYLEDFTPVGFVCWDVSALGDFGPLGVDSAMRGSGIGAALTMSALWAMKWHGYGYGIIHQAGSGPQKFYEKVCAFTVLTT